MKTSLGQPSEKSLIDQQVRQCLEGDALAWRGLFASYYRLIYYLCYKFTESYSEAEDLTQDVFLKLYCNLSRFDSKKGSFANWIRHVTRNHLVDHFRSTQLLRVSDSLDVEVDDEEDGCTRANRLMDVGPSPEQSFASLEVRTRVYAALGQLSVYSREAIILCDLEDRNYLEAAQILGIPEGTVKSRLSRGRVELARALAAGGEDAIRRPVSRVSERTTTDRKASKIKSKPAFGCAVYQSSVA
jgi:RNA polymerase sigma-70 factor (ECF subfamily)